MHPFLLFWIFLYVMPLSIYPGLDGFGTSTVAGSGRHLSPANTTVFKVTTLDPKGSGSIYECVSAEGPRICVFEVSGVISYKGKLNVRNPYITIAGGTAPPPGIMLQYVTVVVNTHDVFIQHLSIRTGDYNKMEGVTPGNRDCLDVDEDFADSCPTSLPDKHNVVFDHISMSYAIDEMFSLWYGPWYVTLYNSFITHSLDESFHEKGPHGKGILIGPGARYTTLKNNFLAHQMDRAPLFGGTSSVDGCPSASHFEWINNVGYNNFRQVVIQHNTDTETDDKQFGHIENNVFIRGPDTCVVNWCYDVMVNVREEVVTGSKFVIRGNSWGNFSEGVNIIETDEENWEHTSSYVKEKYGSKEYQFDPSGETRFTAVEAYEMVVRNSGAFPKYRDEEDTACVNDLQTGTGQVINCVSANGEDRCEKNAGGYPSREENTRKFVIPSEYWIIEENGYTKLENYIMSINREIEDFSCFGIEKDEETVCGGTGSCVNWDLCLCGDTFSTTECDNDDSDDDTDDDTGNGTFLKISLLMYFFLLFFF